MPRRRAAAAPASRRPAPRPSSRSATIATPAVVSAASTRTGRPEPARPALGRALWRLLTSVDFAVAQIIVLALLAVVGMTIRQLPDFAFRSAGDYARRWTHPRALRPGCSAPGLVDVLERLSVFPIFRSAWFSVGLIVLVISIVVCTLDRTPRLWRGVDRHPGRPARAVLRPAAARPGGDGRRRPPTASGASLRRHRFRVREATADDGVDLRLRRPQPVHEAGHALHPPRASILFLVAAAVTSRLGDEQGLVVAEGESLTVQPIGTPGLLLVKNLDFEAPGFETGRPTDFTTDLAVYQDGQEIARKTIRVNDPLVGRRLHVPPERVRAGAAPGRPRRRGPAALGRRRAADRRRRRPPVRDPAGPGPRPRPAAPARARRATVPGVLVVLPYRVVGTDADGTPIPQNFAAVALGIGETRVVRRARPVDRADRRSASTRCSSPSTTRARGSSGSRSLA